MKKTLIITQQRNDAIGIVDIEITQRLFGLGSYGFLQLFKKGGNSLSIIIHYIINIIYLLCKSWHYDVVYFSRENPYVIFVKFFYPRKKTICTIHHVEDYRGKSWVGRLIFKSIDRYIAISKFTKQQLIEHGIDRDKITVIYNGINKDFYPEPQEGFQSYHYILYVGTEQPRKNIGSLLQAFALLIKQYPHIKLVKLGKSHDTHEEELINTMIKELGIEDNIVLLRHYISNDALRKWYSNALCYVSVSRLEGFGLTIPEAMACGCPVVVSDIPPFREIVGNSQVVVDSYDIDSIIDGMMRYINNHKFRSQQAALGLERAKMFDRDRSAKILSDILGK